MADRKRSESGRIAARIPLRVLQAACDRGLDRRALIACLDPDANELEANGIQIDVSRHFALWDEVMRRLRDPGFPIEVGSARSIEDLDVRGFAVVTSSDGWQAFDRAIRYARITSDTIRYELHRIAPDAVRLELHRDFDQSLGVRCATECSVASWVTMIRSVLASDFVPRRICFRHSSPGDVATHQRVLGCLPEFDAAYDAIEVDTAVIDRVPVHRNPAMRAFFDRYVDSLIADSQPPALPLVGEIERSLVSHLSSGPPRMAKVATDLGLSERTLRRRLAEGSVRYQDLVARARVRLARQLLESEDSSLSEIAFLTGFADQSAFSRFFRTQTGTSPSRFRVDRRRIKRREAHER